jgi:hypothetical protein
MSAPKRSSSSTAVVLRFLLAAPGQPASHSLLLDFPRRGIAGSLLHTASGEKEEGAISFIGFGVPVLSVVSISFFFSRVNKIGFGDGRNGIRDGE